MPPAEEGEEEEEHAASPSMLQQEHQKKQQEAEGGGKQVATQVLGCAPMCAVVRVLKPLRRWTLHRRSACTASEFSDCLLPPSYPCWFMP